MTKTHSKDKKIYRKTPPPFERWEGILSITLNALLYA